MYRWSHCVQIHCSQVGLTGISACSQVGLIGTSACTQELSTEAHDPGAGPGFGKILKCKPKRPLYRRDTDCNRRNVEK
jgi:hypothetical protein